MPHSFGRTVSSHSLDARQRDLSTRPFMTPGSPEGFFSKLDQRRLAERINNKISASVSCIVLESSQSNMDGWEVTRGGKSISEMKHLGSDACERVLCTNWNCV